MKARLRGHFANDVMPLRDSPPEDWNKPLPKHLNDASQNSLLVAYVDNNNELPTDLCKKDVVNRMATVLPNCTIM